MRFAPVHTYPWPDLDRDARACRPDRRRRERRSSDDDRGAVAQIENYSRLVRYRRVDRAARTREDRARRNGIPLTREDHRIVVVGSGFPGGGVTALRLAEAGVPVTLLERGKRWATGPDADTFPDASSPDKRILWHKSNPELFGRPVAFAPYVGLLESVSGDNMTAWA